MKETKDKVLKKVIYILSGIVLIGIMILGLPIWQISQINIEGNDFYTDEQIVKVLGGGSSGLNMLQISKSRMTKQVHKLPYIKEVKVTYPALGKIQLQVKEYKSIGYVPFSGTYLSIDEEGKVIAETKLREDALPIIEGITFTAFKLGENLAVDEEEKLVAVGDMMEVLRKNDYETKIEVIDVSNPEEIHLYIDKLDVIIGNMRDFEKKIQWLIETHKNYSMGILDLSHIEQGQAILRPLT